MANKYQALALKKPLSLRIAVERATPPLRHSYTLLHFIMRASAFRILDSHLFVTVASALVLTTLLASSPAVQARSVNLPSPQCHPSVVSKMKPRIQQICKALEAIWEFSDVMENYLDDKETEELIDLESRPMSAAERPLMNAGVKRKGEDVDHVFLRFGKRGLF